MTDTLRGHLERMLMAQDGVPLNAVQLGQWVEEARAALAAAPQPATPGQRMIRAAEEAVAIARGEAEPASVYPAAEHDWGKPVGKEVLPPYQQDREALVEVIREAIQPSIISDVIPALAADALLARGLRLPGGETMAWAAKIILSQPKRPDSPVAEAFTVACAHLEDRECGAETTNEIIETFLKALAGEDN